jgi:hypothetical protein
MDIAIRTLSVREGPTERLLLPGGKIGTERTRLGCVCVYLQWSRAQDKEPVFVLAINYQFCRREGQSRSFKDTTDGPMYALCAELQKREGQLSFIDMRNTNERSDVNLRETVWLLQKHVRVVSSMFCCGDKLVA